MNKIEIEVKTVYGNEMYYPLNYHQELFILTGCKTLTRRHITALNSMGFEFIIHTPHKLNGVLV